MTPAESVQITKELTITLLGKMNPNLTVLGSDNGPKWVGEAYNTILGIIKPDELEVQHRPGTRM